MDRYLIIHYGEIGLKRGNAPYFIEKLRKFLKVRLEKRFRSTFRVAHCLRRFLVKLPEGFVESEYAELLARVPGVKNFKFVFVGGIELDKLGEKIIENMPEFDVMPRNFKVQVKRSMTLPFKSFEAAREIGAMVLRSGFELPVRMKDPDFTIDLEFFNQKGYFSFKTYEGAGGLSPNSQGRLVSLLLSGIDSPVASYMMMRRGARVILINFHAYPYTDKSEMEQAKELAEILCDFQFDSKLYVVPFGDIQKAIATNLDIPGKIRTIMYRRMMLRIAQEVSFREKAKGLVTGDSFGQVASQTAENLFAINDAISIPVYQPLIGMDKEEIIEIAEKIGTFDISKLPCKDSCSMFSPRSPELAARVQDVREYEKDLPIDEWMRKALKDAEVVLF